MFNLKIPRRMSCRTPFTIQSKAVFKSIIDFISNFTDPSTDFKLNGPSEVAGSAIIGALVSQEVIKSFSKTDLPVFNLLIFDSQTLKNIIIKVGVIF